MKQNPIDIVLEELKFTKTEKEGFMSFVKYAKTCQETGKNQDLKSHLENIVSEIVEKR